MIRIRVLEVEEMYEVEVEWRKGHTARCYECGCCILIMTIHAFQISIISTPSYIAPPILIPYDRKRGNLRVEKEEIKSKRKKDIQIPSPLQ